MGTRKTSEFLISAHRALWSVDTLGNLAPEGQEVQNQKWQSFEEQRHRRAFAQTGTWVRKMSDQESPTRAKAGSKRRMGITALWQNGNDEASGELTETKSLVGLLIWTISKWTLIQCLYVCFYVLYPNFSYQSSPTNPGKIGICPWRCCWMLVFTPRWSWERE